MNFQVPSPLFPLHLCLLAIKASISANCDSLHFYPCLNPVQNIWSVLYQLLINDVVCPSIESKHTRDQLQHFQKLAPLLKYRKQVTGFFGKEKFCSPSFSFSSLSSSLSYCLFPQQKITTKLWFCCSYIKFQGMKVDIIQSSRFLFLCK